MPPSPIPAPLPPWARALVQLAPLIAAGLQEALQHIGVMNSVAQATNSEWRHVQILWQPVGNIEAADVQVNSLDIVNITNGTVDNSWTDQDYSDVHTEVSGLIGTYLAQVPTSLQCKEVRYYRRAFNDLSNPKPFAPSGAPERVYTVNLPGTGGAVAVAPQNAITHTEITTYPRHWGRSYWPAPAAAAWQTSGYLTTAFVDAWATALSTRFANMQAKQFFPVVPVTQVQGMPTRGLLTTTKVQVDNVSDVVRRRRKHTTTYRKTLP